MTKKRILLDVDGVCGDFITPTLGVVYDMTGKRYAHDDVVKWELEELVAPEQQDEFWARLSAPGFTRSMLPYADAVQAVQRLIARHEVYFVTAYMHSSSTWVYDRDRWLHEHFGVNYSRVVHTKAKHLVVGDVFVDDKPSNVAAWAEAHPSGKALLFDRGYNRAEEAGVRVCGWDAVFAALENA